jgi:hypothetical protein
MDKSIKFQDALIDYRFHFGLEKGTVSDTLVLGRFTPRTIGGHYFFSKTKQKSALGRPNNGHFVDFVHTKFKALK